MIDFAITRIFKSGNSLAVRIPKEFGLEAGHEYELKRVGDQIRLLRRGRKIDTSGFAGTAPDMRPRSPDEGTFEEAERDWPATERS
ncbi:AbrB/MazE/SpoVT family DNA-binding domain-containing protein [Pacificimonas flava]|uniref:SpoVT-AbrB domain-containing protein n=1 Tax=Pacificimonas flava TaxID=1234595 RepID=M2U6R0_9SPHN|nr:AbrB/MazE/SpoVT family DNA-binding domain-containing protein [Pacificimonas flava]EMD83683.1 hypothetical protein C725_0655 [Pacificimonas flava]MBB5280634.1 antitoxin VapB [Pacificimonas flava]